MKIITIAFASLFVVSGLQAQGYYPLDQFGLRMCEPGSRLIKRDFSHSYVFDHRYIYTAGDMTGGQNFLLPAAGRVTPLLLTTMDGEPDWADGLRPDLRARTLVSAGLFIPTIATGYLMRGSNGSPDDVLLAIHKLSTVSNLFLLDATLLKKRKTASLSWLESVVAVTMNVSFVATISTGGAQSIGRPMPAWVNTTHQITPWITMLASGTLLYLLNK